MPSQFWGPADCYQSGGLYREEALAQGFFAIAAKEKRLRLEQEGRPPKGLFELRAAIAERCVSLYAPGFRLGLVLT